MGNGNGKMGIMATDAGVHIVKATENKKNIELICRWRRNVNERSQCIFLSSK